MKIFISCLGQRSQNSAERLAHFLRGVLPFSEPTLSSQDHDGWMAACSRALGSPGVGILCVTGNNLQEPGLAFDAGALCAAFGRSGVFLYVLDTSLNHRDIPPPLSQFQARQASARDTLRLLRDISRADAANNPLPEAQWSENFKVWWHQLDRDFREIRSSVSEPPTQLQELRSLMELQHAKIDALSETLRVSLTGGIVVFQSQPEEAPATARRSRHSDLPSDSLHPPFEPPPIIARKL